MAKPLVEKGNAQEENLLTIKFIKKREIKLNKEKIFYVYGYFRLDNNSFFYIGKGKDKRCETKQNRPKHFMNIIKKIPYRTIILYNNLTEEDAYKYEKEVIENLVDIGYSIDIKGYKKKDFHLTNQCWGGKGGLTGIKRSEETKKKLSEQRLGKYTGKDNPHSTPVILLNNLEIFDCIINASKKYNLNSTSIIDCCQNKNHYGGKLNDENLVWMYLEDYNNSTEDEINERKQDIYRTRHGENSSFYGRKHTPESIAKMKKAHTGVKPSEETRKKLSEMRKGENNNMWGKRGELSPHYGKKYSEERKNNISKSLGTPVKCIELNIIFNSLSKAEQFFIQNYNIKFSHKTLKETLEGKRKKDWYKEIEINGVKTKLHWKYC